MVDAVVIPENAVASPAPPDILTPVRNLLQGINLLGAVPAAVVPAPGTESDTSANTNGTLPGVAILEANATKVSKLFAGLAGGSGALAGIGAAIASFWNIATPDLRLVIVGGASAVMAFAVMAVAIIVNADLKSRAAGQIAIYQARQAITTQFLAASLTASTRGAPPAAGAAVASTSTPRPVVPIPPEHLVVMLAAAREAALVEFTDGRQGNLAGLKENNGVVSVGWIPTGSGNISYDSPSDFKVVSFTFPLP